MERILYHGIFLTARYSHYTSQPLLSSSVCLSIIVFCSSVYLCLYCFIVEMQGMFEWIGWIYCFVNSCLLGKISRHTKRCDRCCNKWKAHWNAVEGEEIWQQQCSWWCWCGITAVNCQHSLIWYICHLNATFSPVTSHARHGKFTSVQLWQHSVCIFTMCWFSFVSATFIVIPFDVV